MLMDLPHESNLSGVNGAISGVSAVQLSVFGIFSTVENTYDLRAGEPRYDGLCR